MSPVGSSRVSAAAAIAIATAVTTAIAIVIPTTACEKLPTKTCAGDRAAIAIDDAGQSGSDRVCAECLQTKCCDAVGFCDEEPGCIDRFVKAHQCVLREGPGRESECISDLGPPTTRGRQLYDCMRRTEGCGHPSDIAAAPCHVSSCVLSPAVVLVVNPRCDTCFAGSCCKEINDCYGDRRCKLTVECIVKECAGTLAAEMASFASVPPHVAQEFERAACVGQAGQDAAGGEGGDGGQAGAPTLPDSCVTRCLEAYAPVAGTADDQSARCRAFRVYDCAAGHGCASECGDADDGGADDAAIGGDADGTRDADVGDSAADAAPE